MKKGFQTKTAAIRASFDSDNRHNIDVMVSLYSCSLTWFSTYINQQWTVIRTKHNYI